MRTATAFALALSLAGPLAPALAHAAGPEVPAQWGTYTIQLVDEYGAVLPTFQHRGRTYVLGTLGQRYVVRVWNGSWRRAEVVVSVDGRDVIDGRPSAFEKRGYIVEAQGEVTIDGYRLDESSVAAFRFSSVPRSYASRKGDARDVGVIGVAVFPERQRRWVPPPPPRYPYPQYPGYGEGRGPEARSNALPPSGADSGVASAPEPGERAEKHAGPAPSAPQPVPPGAMARPEPQRPGLGTEFGEQHGSPVTQVPFERASSRPDAVLTLRYDDRDALVALGIDVDRRHASYGDDAWMRETSDPFRRNGFAEPPAGWRP